jgi:hypothetical protein
VSGKPYVVRFCEDGEIGQRGFSRVGCISRNDFFRSVLLTGLQDESVIGVNPYKFGVIGSTDTHIAAAGATDEAAWRGHLVTEAELPARLKKPVMSPQGLDGNPGGLAGIWAVENSRDALFEALRRREVFGTTGTRIRPRLFAGWDFAKNACDLENQAEYGYRMGVPMGSDLQASTSNRKPKLLATALKDPDGAALEKLQIIKGWIDADGQMHDQVIDIAGQKNAAGAIDLESGQWSGGGSSALCTVFEDADFDPAQPAYYYLRAVEVPTLRWNQAQCVALPTDQRPAGCENEAPKTTRELAWTSPIWYLPPTAD